MKKLLLSLLLFIAINITAQTVYITNTGEKYHRGDCRYLSKSKIAIELDEAIKQGYNACKVCKPPQTVSVQEKKIKEEGLGALVKKETSTQCVATTQAGTRCKRMTKSTNGKCWQHGGN